MGVRAAKARMHFFQKKVIMTVKKHGLRTSVSKPLNGVHFFSKTSKPRGSEWGGEHKSMECLLFLNLR